MSTALYIDLETVLTEDEINSLPFATYRGRGAVMDFIRAIQASGGGPVYCGVGDSYFPDFVTMTQNEMEEVVDFWVEEQKTTFNEDCWQSRSAISEGVYDATVEVDSEIVEKILNAIDQSVKLREHYL